MGSTLGRTGLPLRGTLEWSITQEVEGPFRIGAALGGEPSFPDVGRQPAGLSTFQCPPDPSTADGAPPCFPVGGFAPTSNMRCLPETGRSSACRCDGGFVLLSRPCGGLTTMAEAGRKGNGGFRGSDCRKLPFAQFEWRIRSASFHVFGAGRNAPDPDADVLPGSGR